MDVDDLREQGLGGAPHPLTHMYTGHLFSQVQGHSPPGLKIGPQGNVIRRSGQSRKGVETSEVTETCLEAWLDAGLVGLMALKEPVGVSRIPFLRKAAPWCCRCFSVGWGLLHTPQATFLAAQDQGSRPHG